MEFKFKVGELLAETNLNRQNQLYIVVGVGNRIDNCYTLKNITEDYMCIKNIDMVHRKLKIATPAQQVLYGSVVTEPRSTDG